MEAFCLIQADDDLAVVKSHLMAWAAAHDEQGSRSGDIGCLTGSRSLNRLVR